ncbi:MAG: AbrB/MazE/SpoVT family DNA-binding domain-containing protein [Candidatus Thorarchaeota archaeon]|nr:AbrB/MazE/SpoVT family DNA-binding domain-containing protein [Candidatus Thorarchaeota archaeon]
MGMGDYMGKSEVDERGRITIPKELRDKLGFKSGDSVRLTATKDGVTIEKAINLSFFIEELRGCITIEGDLDPLKLKEIWRTVP